MHEDKSMRRFSQALQSWTRQPPKKSASAARASIQRAVETPQPAATWHRSLATVVVLVLVAVAGFFFVSFSADEPKIEEAALPAPEAERFLIVTLASGNRLYIPISQPSSGRQ